MGKEQNQENATMYFFSSQSNMKTLDVIFFFYTLSMCNSIFTKLQGNSPEIRNITLSFFIDCVKVPVTS